MPTIRVLKRPDGTTWRAWWVGAMASGVRGPDDPPLEPPPATVHFERLGGGLHVVVVDAAQRYGPDLSALSDEQLLDMLDTATARRVEDLPS